MGAHSCLPFENDGRVFRMILTCPSCGTQYVVKDGAIPPGGRQVRCKACQHSWREMPSGEQEPTDAQAPPPAAPPPVEDSASEGIEAPHQNFSEVEPVSESPAEQVGEDAPDSGSYAQDEPLAEAPEPLPIPPEAEVPELAEAAPSGRLEWVEQDEDFSPFAPREEEKSSRSKLVIGGIVILLIAAIVAGVWFFAPAELRQRLGIAGTGETPLQLMMTHSDRTQLASGNEFLNISGRIINPTDEQQKVPPITAQLHDASGKVVYKWTIPPPTKTIPPGGSASFNSAELNIPPAAQELTVTLGEPKNLGL
jgi:predicted Zn finger-like uncharacterized protein